MPRTSESVVLLDATVVAGSSGTKGAPGAVTPGGFYNNQANYNSPLGIYIENDTVAPGTPLTVVIQASDDGVIWTDYDTVAGDSVAFNSATMAGTTSKTIILEKVRFVRAIAFGNTSRDVKVRVRMHAVTGL